MEIEELKKRKNQDQEDVKRVKVELQKMEVLYKKYKELIDQNGGINGVGAMNLTDIAGSLPFNLANGQDPSELAQILSTEEVLIETTKIKNFL